MKAMTIAEQIHELVKQLKDNEVLPDTFPDPGEDLSERK